jgi:hypothetical protein
MELSERELLKTSQFVLAKPIHEPTTIAVRWDNTSSTRISLEMFTQNRLRIRHVTTMHLEFSYRAPGYPPTNYSASLNDFLVFAVENNTPKALQIIPFYEFIKTYKYYTYKPEYWK